MAAVITYISQGAAYVYHTRAGVRADYDLSIESNAAQTADGYLAMKSYLPADLPNWTRHDHSDAGHPFAPSLDNQIWSDVLPLGVLHAFAATSGIDFVVAPTAIRGYVDLGASRAMQFDVINPLTGAVLDNDVALAVGETYRLDDVPEAAILIGQFR